MNTQEALYLNIIDNLKDGVYFVDLERRIRFWSKAAERITGYTQTEMLGTSCQQTLLNHIDEEGRPLCIVGCPLFDTLGDGQQRQARVFVRHKEGYRLPIHVNIFPMVVDGKITGAVEVFTADSDTVYEDRLVEKLTGIAMHDTLTDLPNRRYLESFLDYKLSEFTRFDRLCAVLFADIDDFRVFNNTYGHDVGDLVLKNIAASLKSNTRKSDLVGRLGGEELLGIYSIADPASAPIVAEKLRRLVESTEIPHGDGALHVSVSVGVTVVRPGDTPDVIVKRADDYMYRSKQNGKNRVTADEDMG